MRLTPFYQQDIALAVEEGKIAEGTKLIIRQLNRRIGEISPLLIAQIQKLPIEQIESLGEALLDFNKLDDLETWLNQNQES
jgi:heme oxygenase